MLDNPLNSRITSLKNKKLPISHHSLKKNIIGNNTFFIIFCSIFYQKTIVHGRVCFFISKIVLDVF